jgi:hypothetical protein
VSANPWVAFIVVSVTAALQKILALPRENIMPVFFGTFGLGFRNALRSYEQGIAYSIAGQAVVHR